MLRASLARLSSQAANAARPSYRVPTASLMPAGPVEEAIVAKLEALLKPTFLEVRNDSSKHAGHAAMRAQGGGSGETHFAVTAVSEVFEGQRHIQRHKLVNTALREELERPGGVHALSLRLKTPREAEAEAAQAGGQ